MARDKDAQDRIETTLYAYFNGATGAAAEDIYDDEVAPLIMHLENLLAAQSGIPIDAIEFGRQVDQAREVVANSKRISPVAVDQEDNVNYVEIDREGNTTWVMKDGSRQDPPEGWTNDIPGVKGFSATKISDDGKTEL